MRATADALRMLVLARIYLAYNYAYTCIATYVVTKNYKLLQTILNSSLQLRMIQSSVKIITTNHSLSAVCVYVAIRENYKYFIFIVLPCLYLTSAKLLKGNSLFEHRLK